MRPGPSGSGPAAGRSRECSRNAVGNFRGGLSGVAGEAGVRPSTLLRLGLTGNLGLKIGGQAVDADFSLGRAAAN